MAKRKKAQSKGKTVATLTHDEAKRRNIPTAEFQPLLAAEEQSPVRVAYERRNRDLDPQLVWRGKDEQDWSDLVVHAPPLYIQEKVHPKVLIDDLLRQTKERRKEQAPDAPDLFAEFNGLPDKEAVTEFYRHDANWSNRMILGDSLQVMASLAEREGLRGQVQCIYIDPPYGIKFNSNFQWSTTSRDVTDGKKSHITREPEQVRAFRDTWRDGIHSYLTYLRDRLTVARDLLADSGSIFVQIGDENVHRVRALMDEVFGERNFVAQIAFSKTGSATGNIIGVVCDHMLFYAKHVDNLKYRKLYIEKGGEDEDVSEDPLKSEGFRAGTTFDYFFRNRSWPCRQNEHWKVTREGLGRLERSDRIIPKRTSLRLRKFRGDFPVKEFHSVWLGFGGASNMKYIVETSWRVVERCILMTTDPGDLVLDPTCGSGTTAFVAEQRGRRWITVDTSRVALALARSRVMGARYPYYYLADSPEGQRKEAEITRKAPSEAPTHGDLRQGFVYERVPHITLKSIANNAEIDVIWERFQEELEPLRKDLNAALGKSWEEWEIPREADGKWPDRVKGLHKAWWDKRIARQTEIDASIAAKAESEYLYDKPYDDPSRIRVAGPFTVESLSPHRVLAVDQDDELVDTLAATEGERPKPNGGGGETDFAQVMIEQLKVAGVQQAHKADRIAFTSVVGWPGRFICAEGRFLEGERERRAGILIGPEFGTVSRPDLVAAAREAADAGFDVLIACAFNFDAHSAEFDKLGRVPVLKARMNPDLHMADELKTTKSGNLFVVFGEPDIEIENAGDDRIRVRIKGVDVFHPQTGGIDSGGPDSIALWMIDTD